nr:homeodomain-like protein [Tanacetum cinerariifolium]
MQPLETDGLLLQHDYQDQQTHNFKEEDIESSPSASSKPFGDRDQTNCSQLNSPQYSYSDISSVITNDNGDIKKFSLVKSRANLRWLKKDISTSPA